MGQLQQQTHIISQFAQEKREVRSEGREVHGELAVLRERVTHREEECLKLHSLCEQLNEQLLEKSQQAEELQMTDALREDELQCLRARIQDMRAANSKIAMEFEELSQHAADLERTAAENENARRSASQQMKTLRTQVE